MTGGDAFVACRTDPLSFPYQNRGIVSAPEEDFASMFEASLKAKRIERGQTVSGTLVAIGDEVAFVDVGGKGEALLDVAELKDADGQLEAAVGDRVQAVVVSTEGGITLSRRLVRGAVTDSRLESAFSAGLGVEGKVEREVKGGYEVRIGGQRAFCPFSQIDIVRSTTPAQHLGRLYTFRIIEYKDGGSSLVVSRRALLEEEQRAQAEVVRSSVVPGAVLSGRVASVRDFGAFIDLGGGVQGLLHVSEMGWSRVTDPTVLFTPGDAITVKVLRVDEATDKIALGLKQLSEDPWSAVETKYVSGQRVTGRVVRVTDFGAFIELEPGIEGLAHASTFAPTGHSKGWAKAVPPGSTATFEVLSVDPEKKRIAVALVDQGATDTAGVKEAQSTITAGARLVGKVERHEKFGVLVFLAPGRTGLMPLSETGIAREGDVAKAFPLGSDLEVVVLEADTAGRRIRVSRKAVLEAQEADEVRAYATREEASTARSSFGSLADKLRGALDPRDK